MVGEIIPESRATSVGIRTHPPGRTQRQQRQATRGGRRNLVEMVDPGSVAAGDLGLLLFAAVAQNLLDDLPAPREGGLDMGVIRAPEEVVDTDDVAVAD